MESSGGGGDTGERVGAGAGTAADADADTDAEADADAGAEAGADADADADADAVADAVAEASGREVEGVLQATTVRQTRRIDLFAIDIDTAEPGRSYHTPAQAGRRVC